MFENPGFFGPARESSRFWRKARGQNRDIEQTACLGFVLLAVIQRHCRCSAHLDLSPDELEVDARIRHRVRLQLHLHPHAYVEQKDVVSSTRGIGPKKATSS